MTASRLQALATLPPHSSPAGLESVFETQLLRLPQPRIHAQTLQADSEVLANLFSSFAVLAHYRYDADNVLLIIVVVLIIIIIIIIFIINIVIFVITTRITV